MGILSGFWGRRSRYKTRKNRGPSGNEKTLVESHRVRRTGLGRRTHAEAVKRNTAEGRYERMVYERKYARGGWGRGARGATKRGKVKLSAEERKEENRLAARRRYHAKHPGAKYRKPK